MNRLFLWISASMIIGIISSYYSHFNISIIIFLFLITCIYSFYSIKREKLNNIKFFLLLFLLLGILLEILSSGSHLKQYIDKTKDYSGVVKAISKDSQNKKKYIVEIHTVDNRKIPKEKTLINLIGKENLEIGWKIDFYGKANLPKRNTNPNLFNYREYLLSNRIYTIINIKDYNIESIENTSSYRDEFKTSVSFKIDNLYDKYLNSRNSSIIKGMILGDSVHIEEGDLNNYRQLGLAHILAISGLHIGILSGFLLFLFSRLGVKRDINILLVLIVLWTYAFIVGFPASILRANLMLSILLISQIIHEPYDNINSVFLSMFILLIFNPYNIFNIGFIMSYIATIFIIILTPRIKMIFYPYENNMTSTLSGIMAVQIGLMPVLAYYFNRIPLLSIIGNLFIIPLLSISIILGFSMFIIEPVISILNLILGYFLNLLLDFQFLLVDLLASFSFKEIKIASPNIFTILLYYIFVFLLFKIINIENLNKRVLKSIYIYLILFIFISFISTELDETVEVHFIDVGQGDSILLRSSKSDYLIDTGGNLFGDFDIGENITLPYLEKIGVRQLKTVFITHFHEDHYKGLYALLKNLEIDYIASGYIPDNKPILKAINDEKVPFILLNTGDKLNLGKDLKMDILWPEKQGNYSENNMSLVAILKYKNQKLLFTGDMEREVERELLDRIEGEMDIIKIPHHGSSTSSTVELLNKIKPDIGIISVGRNNLYNHPSQEVLDRYRDMDTGIYRTDELGLIKLILNKDKIYIKGFLMDDVDKIIYSIYCSIYYLISYILIKNHLELERRINYELQ